MAIKECSLYKFVTKAGTVLTTPKDITARKLAQRRVNFLSPGGTHSFAVDLTSVQGRVLIITHGSDVNLRGIYLIRANDGVFPAVVATDVTVSLSGSTLTITNNTTTRNTLRYIVI